MSKVILLTRVVTATVHLAFFPLPSVADTVIVAVPLPTAVTVPSLFTVATDVLEDDQAKVASEGSTVATSFSLSPVCKAKLDLLTDNNVTGIPFCVTVNSSGA